MPLKQSSDKPVSIIGERRQVTALFYDIVGSTELLVHSNPEQFSVILNEFHENARKVVTSLGGFIHLKMGDGACCYFNYPNATEDSAERAVLAAIALANYFGEKRSSRLKKLKVRVGVATSLVVISSDGKDIIGTAPVLAARLQTQAEPDTVLVSDSTYNLTKDRIVYQYCDVFYPKGFADAVNIWRPIAAISGNALQKYQLKTPLQGRKTEIDSLLEIWKTACAGKGRCVTIFGESGIGKSRLVAEFCNRVSDKRILQHTLSCQSRSTSQPLHPIFNWLEALLLRPLGEFQEPGSLRDELKLHGLETDEKSANVFQRFVSAKPTGSIAQLNVIDDARKNARIEVIEIIINMIIGNSNKPVLLIFEDMHWADTLTLEFINQLIRKISDKKILLLMTARSDDIFKENVQQIAEYIALNRLGEHSITAIVTAIFGKKPPRALASFILAMSDGNALFAEELTKFLLTRAQANSSIADLRQLLIENGVATLNDLLSARLDDAADGRRTAQLASVVGREFNTKFLKEIIRDRNEDIDKHIKNLVDLGILEARSDSENIYMFKHALLQEAAYTSLLRSDRRKFHRRVATLIIDNPSHSFPPDVAAWHCSEGGFPLESAKLAIHAAESCIARSAMHEAWHLLLLAKTQIAKLKSSRVAVSIRLDLFQLMGVVAIAIFGEGSQQARRLFEQALSLLKTQSFLTQSRRFPIFWGWWFTASNLNVQQARSKVLVQNMSSVDDPETRLQSFHCAWATSFHAAQHDFCQKCIADGLALYDLERAQRSRVYYGGHDAKVCALGEKALSLLLTGDEFGAEQSIEACIAWGTTVDHVGSLLHALYYAVVLRRCQARYDDVIQLSAWMKTVAEENGMAASFAKANLFGGWASAKSGLQNIGIQRFEEALELQRKIGTEDNLSIEIDMQSEIQEIKGMQKSAVDLLGSAISSARRGGQLFWLAELHRRRAGMRYQIGKSSSSVESDLRNARRIAVGQSAEWLLARVDRTISDLGLSEPDR